MSKFEGYERSGTLTRKRLYRLSFLIGTPVYLCPEIFHDGCPTLKSDLYSLGVMLYRLIFGIFPQQLLNEKITFSSCYNQSEVNFPENVKNDIQYDSAIHLISHLIQKEPLRLDWNSYFDHPYFIS